MKKKVQEKVKAFIDSEIILGGQGIMDNARLKEVVGHCKGLGLKIVLTQGSWDLIHIGHARYMQEAKKYGDLLVVGVDSDEKIRSRKGPERPIVPQEERMEMITHLRHVDLVALKQLQDPKWHMIKLVSPDVLIATKRQGYSKEELKELKKYCGKIVMLEAQATTSTSAKIRSMQISTAKKLQQNLTPKLLKAIEDVISGMN